MYKLLGKIDKLLVDTIVAGDVAQNTAKGDVDLINRKRKRKMKKSCGMNNETTSVGAPYASGNSTIAGSGQTRVVGVKRHIISALRTKEPVEDENDDKTKENLGRPDLNFDPYLGAYVPKRGGPKRGVEDE